MATIDITLPDPMKDWVNAQTKSGRYADASDYARDLIRQDQERADKVSQLQALINQGLASGVSEASIDDVLARARKAARQAKLRPKGSRAAPNRISSISMSKGFVGSARRKPKRMR